MPRRAVCTRAVGKNLFIVLRYFQHVRITKSNQNKQVIRLLSLLSSFKRSIIKTVSLKKKKEEK